MINLLIGIAVVLTCIIVFILIMNVSEKNNKKQADLFRYVLEPMVFEANDAKSVKEAWDTLHLECLRIDSMDEYYENGGGYFKLNPIYRDLYKQLEGRLLCKNELLKYSQNENLGI